MRILILSGVLVGLGLGCGARQQTSEAAASPGPAAVKPGEVVVRWRFSGIAQLRGNTNAASLREVWALPSTQKVVEEALGKLAAAPPRLFKEGWAAGNIETTPLLRPLLDDLLQAESQAECRGTAGPAFEWTLAVRLDEARVGLWRANWEALMTALGATEPLEFKSEGFTAWEAKRSGTPNLFRLVRAGEWLVAGWGQDALPSLAEWLKRIKAGGRPSPTAMGGWLELEVNLPCLSKSLGLSEKVRWPQAQLTFTGRGTNVRATGRFVFAEAPGFKLDPWRIPTQTIREPLISFTAMRGAQPWLSGAPLFSQLGLLPVPNQLFGWAQSQTPFQTYFAWTLPDITNTLEKAALRLPEVLKSNYPRFAIGEVTYLTNRAQLSWKGLPVLLPFLRPAPVPESDFVVAGVFPTTGTGKAAAPAELYAQVTGPTNLVYYDWEITEHRVRGWLTMRSFYDMVGRYAPPPTNSAAMLWLVDTNMTRHLGNAVTELTLQSPREMSGMRTSAIGLSGFELVCLAYWIANPAFPAYKPIPAIGPRSWPATGAKPGQPPTVEK